MYRKAIYKKSQLTSVELVEGEPIEWKIERIVSNGEPIKDGAPEIFTERKEGVVSAYNIRTDRWEVASEAMDKVSASIQAKRDSKGTLSKQKTEEKGATKEPEKVEVKVGEPKSAKGTEKP